MITLQIIPLNKLEDKQLGNIERLDSNRLYLLSSKDRKKDKEIILKIQRREFTYMLLGLKQASLADFREVLKDPIFQARIRLITINKYYLIKQESKF